MDEDRALIKSVHHATEGPKILRGRRLEIYRDVNVRHAKAGDDAAFVREGIVGGGERKVDNGFKTGYANLAKLFLCRLAGSGQFRAEGTEVVNVG